MLIASELVLDPAQYADRIVHEVCPEEGHLANVVTTELAIPFPYPIDESDDSQDNREQGPLFVPLIWPERGTLIDNLSTRSSDGFPVPVVASAFSRYLTVAILRYLTLELFAFSATDIPVAVSQLLNELTLIVETDVGIVHSQGDATRSEAAIAKLAELPRPLLASNDWEARRERLTNLWRASLSSYIIFGEIDLNPGERVSLTVEYTVPMTAENFDPASVKSQKRQTAKNRDRSAFTRDHLRFVLGLRPHVYRFLLFYENAAKSYHLRFSMPEDQYIYQVDVTRTTAAPAAHSIMMRSPESTATRYAHLYVRPIPHRNSPGQLQARIDARERPPGVLGFTAIIAIVEAVFVLFLLFGYSAIFGNAANPDYFNFVPALLLAVPGFLSAWIANQITPSRAQRMPLAAAGGIALNAAIAIVGTLLAILAVRRSDASNSSHVWLFAHPLWLALAIVSVWHAANMSGRFAQNITIFVTRLRRRPELRYREV